MFKFSFNFLVNGHWILNLKKKKTALSVHHDLFFILSHQKQSTHYHHPQVFCGGPCRDDVMHVKRWKLSGDRVVLDPNSKKKKKKLFK